MFLSVMGSNVMAQVPEGPKVVLERKFKINAEVNTATVRCSAIGYGYSELKINLRELKGKTVFDHSNARFGEFNQPCMTAGACVNLDNEQVFSIEDVIQGNPRTEEIEVTQTLLSSKSKVENPTTHKLVCEKELVERLETAVGGVPFFHVRSAVVETLPE